MTYPALEIKLSRGGDGVWEALGLNATGFVVHRDGLSVYYRSGDHSSLVDGPQIATAEAVSLSVPGGTPLRVDVVDMGKPVEHYRARAVVWSNGELTIQLESVEPMVVDLGGSTLVWGGSFLR
jgi:hypothetical protein